MNGNRRCDCHRCFQGHFLPSCVSVTPPPTRSPPLWMVRQCMNPDCRVDRVNSRGSKPLSDIDYVFLICFCCRAPMTHTSLLLLFLYSGSSLASPPCRLCTSSSTHTPKKLNFFWATDKIGAQTMNVSWACSLALQRPAKQNRLFCQTVNFFCFTTLCLPVAGMAVPTFDRFSHASHRDSY